MMNASRFDFPLMFTSLTTLTLPWCVQLIAGTPLRKGDATQVTTRQSAFTQAT
jgi:hypothetical protein